jgi:hypothetical protein
VSSAVLYLAIVALWAVVLVPMWLRRDGDPGRLGLSWLPHRRPGTTPEVAAGYQEAALYHDAANPADSAADFIAGRAYGQPERPERPEQWRRRRSGGRAAVIARRRRGTLCCALVVIASVAIVSAGLVPFWTVLPPVGLLAAHLSLLRVAAGMDAARREAAARARAAERAAARAAQAAADAAHAEIIDLMERNRARDVFDQYAHGGLRAVGD